MDKYIASKTSRSVSSIPWNTPEKRRKIRRKNKTYAKAIKTGGSKLRSKFETLRREIKADVRKQHDLYVNNLVGDVEANPRDFYRYINSQKKDTQGIPPLKRSNGKSVAQSDLEKAEQFNGQFTDVFNKNEHTQVPLLDRSAPFMDDTVVSKDGVTRFLKGLNPSKALGPCELHPRVLWGARWLSGRVSEREVGGSKPTAAVLCPSARHFTPRKYWLITQEAVAPSRHD